jgi:Ni,Fe-hydrogenase III large subunit
MSEYTTLPFGPQQPRTAGAAPIQTQDGRRTDCGGHPAIGYVHRGLERLIQVRDFSQMVYVVERVCGICSVMHAQTYCQGIEELMGIQVPDRARYLRVVWAELHRIHSHLLALGLLADSFGFESLFMHTWRIRERILDMLEATTSHRILISINIIGGTRRDLSTEQIAMLRTELDTVQADFREGGAGLCQRIHHPAPPGGGGGAHQRTGLRTGLCGAHGTRQWPGAGPAPVGLCRLW